MSFKKLLLRSQNLLLNPSSEFKVIFAEQASVRIVNRSFVLPVSLTIAAFSLVGSIFSNISSPVYSFFYVGINSIIVFLLMFVHVYLSGKSIGLLGQYLSPGGKYSDYYSLAAYSQLPFFITLALIKLLPSLLFLLILGLYSAVLFNTGTGIMTKIPRGKRLQFTILSLLIMIISFIICSEFFTLLYSEILAQFSTFDVL